MTAKTDPYINRLMAWVHERFPLPNAIMFFTLYFCAAFLGRMITAEGPILVGKNDLGGCLVTWALFLLIRVVDEHKDYESDVRNYPERVLQRGLITLENLQTLGAGALGIIVGWSLWLDHGLGPVVMSLGVVFIWFLLMSKEFFCGEWLEKHITLYAVSHMVLMPMVLFWLMNLGASPAGVEPLNVAGLLLMALSFISGMAFELTRKTRGPEEEREGVDSYSKAYGTKGSAYIIMTLQAVVLICQLWLMREIVQTATFNTGLVILCLAFGLSWFSLIQFIRNPTEKGRKMNEGMVGLSGLLGYGAIIAAMIVERGIQ
ncbi:MAG: UbiA family prenyltransferase [SAR324 cluster bacterium]|nr:UbiA family prenyltransferase [SAR324 cluster bacterium]